MALLLLVLAGAAFGQYESYEGQQVLSCQLNSELKESFYTVIQDKGLIDVWGVHANDIADILVRNATEKSYVLDFFASTNCTVKLENVADSIRFFDELQANASASSDDWFASYHTFDENYNWWVAEQQKYSQYTTVKDLPTKSIENRPIQTFEINVDGRTKPVIYIQCQIHAREWVSTPTCQYVIDQLLIGYNTKQSEETKILSNFNFAVVTCTNPDGFVYTHTVGGRQWRKNRRVNTGSTCRGVDLNRNYNVQWGKGGSSTDPCSDTFMGASAGSEPEVQATVNYILSLQQRAPLWAGIDVHSYSQLVLRPYGSTNADSPNEKQMAQLGSLWVDGIKATTGKSYTSQKSIQLYVTTGTASDWFYDSTTGAAKTNGKQNGLIIHPAGFTVELRPTSSNPGFQLPPGEILPTGQENYRGLKNFFLWFIDVNSGPLLAST